MAAKKPVAASGSDKLANLEARLAALELAFRTGGRLPEPPAEDEGEGEAA